VLGTLIDDPVPGVQLSWQCGNALPFRPLGDGFPLSIRRSVGRTFVRLGADPADDLVAEIDPTSWSPVREGTTIPYRRPRPHDPFEEPTSGGHRSLAVEVVDPDGRPVPFATVYLHLPSWRGLFDVDDVGVQRLDPFTDLHGRRTFRGLPPGDTRVVALWGPLSGHADVDVQDGAAATLRIRLRG
jgi:hypothetical protein